MDLIIVDEAHYYPTRLNSTKAIHSLQVHKLGLGNHMTPQLEFSDSRYQQKKVAKLEYPHPTPRFLYIVMEKCEAVSADNKKNN